MVFLLAILISQFNPVSETLDFYSGRFFATSFLMKGPQEFIQNPSYLFLIKNSHLFLNLDDFAGKSKLFVFGGNVKSEPLTEGGFLKIGGERRPVINAFGTSGYLKKDTLQFEDSGSSGSYDRARLVKLEVNGDSSVFNLLALIGFQFLYENWFVSASFFKSQVNTEYQRPGDTLRDFGYFKYTMIEATHPENRFIMQKIGTGDFALKEVQNQNYVRIGGGAILSDSSFVSLLLGYKTSEERKTSSGYFSWIIDTDTTRQETHLIYDQGRIDDEVSFTGRGYSVNLDYYVPKGQNSFREAGIFFLRDRVGIDNMSKIHMTYIGNYNTVADTFVQKFDSLNYSEESFVSSKGRYENYFKVYYAEIYELNPSARIALGIKGFYRYGYLNLSYTAMDSIYVRFSDGDSVVSDQDDYERIVMLSKSGLKVTEEKEYGIEIPAAVEVNPLNLKWVTLWFGSLFNFTHRVTAEELRIFPVGEKVDSIFRGDSTSIVTKTPISQLRQRASSLRENTNVFFTYGLNLDLNKNITFAACFRNRLNQFDAAKFSVVIKF